MIVTIPLSGTLGLLLNLDDIGAFLTTSIAIAGFLFVLTILFSVLRAVFRRLSNDLPLVTLEVSRIPLILITILISIRVLLPTLPSEASNSKWIQVVLTVLLFGVLTFWASQLVNQVLVYGLKQYAQESEAMWDDVLVPIIEAVMPVAIYLIGGLFILQALGADLSALLVALGGVGFILGFALKDILANFFSGLVLLIDTPFNFGDVIVVEGKDRAVIRKIGLRVTQLYLIDSHSEIYIPNASLQGSHILNLSRPTNHYYYTVSIPIKADVDPSLAIDMMQKVILAHPGTMGKIEDKLAVIDLYYGHSLPILATEKRAHGKQKLLAEKYVSNNLHRIEAALGALIEKLGIMEKGGLDGDEARILQGYYLEICQAIGLELVSDRQNKRKPPRLMEISGTENQTMLIPSIRHWYQAWTQDPDLFKEDLIALPRYWEQRLGVLKLKVNKVFKVVNNPIGQETRIDTRLEELRLWMQESFKASLNEWQNPKVLVNEVKGDYTRDTIVKFYIDDIKLEHCERGNRIKSEVRQELIWHLRKAYLI